MVIGARVWLYRKLSIEYRKVLQVNIITPSDNLVLNFELASQSDSKVPSVEINLFLETDGMLSVTKWKRENIETDKDLTLL